MGRTHVGLRNEMTAARPQRGLALDLPRIEMTRLARAPRHSHECTML
jgi:hypothetical protein